MAGRPAKEPAPALRSDIKTDVAIIGGGYTGLATAYHLKTAEPGLDVTVLEAMTTGFGASGRNGGFVITLFGASLGLMKAFHGKEAVREAHAYMERSIQALELMLKTHSIDCDYERSGFLKVATTSAYMRRIRHEINLLQSLGIEGFQLLDREEIQGRVRSETYLGACLEPNCALLNPVKWADALERLALENGARLYESTRVTRVRREAGRYRITTDAGSVAADHVVFATNAYTHLLPGLAPKQVPAFAYIVVTAKLSDAQRAAIGWAGREGIEDARNFMHFYRLTPDGRLLMGGGPGFVPYAGRMDNDANPFAWDHLRRFIGRTFPALADIKIDYKWGGAFSVAADSTPHVGTLDGGGATYAIGCTGHGVAMSHMNGRIISDLVLNRKTDLTQLWFVNRRPFPIPPEPLRSIAVRSVMTAMKLDDWWCDRGGPR
ncbi:MAG: FAD-dependent oxidoreductase [Hyphomicrobiaceae bacterium]|nr:MAG: FAD-dependent oxidoreductase [Hyphomicrobiaceae bacterium]